MSINMEAIIILALKLKDDTYNGISLAALAEVILQFRYEYNPGYFIIM